MSKWTVQEDVRLNDDDREKIHFHRIVTAMRLYRVHSLKRIEQTESFLNSLPAKHQELLKSYNGHLQDIKTCIERNSEVIQLMMTDVSSIFENAEWPSDTTITGVMPDSTDMEKVQSTLKQLVRDWSVECAEERAACYQPIIEEIVANFPLHLCAPENVRILVPGAGLGRLAHEIAQRGYTCQGNEFSLFMLFASNFVLNRCKGANLHTIYPWVHQFVNNLSSAHQTQGVTFPDIDPSELPDNPHFSMTAGDFLEVYTHGNDWHCIATSFFIDCANNIVAFIETIYHILKPGGLWVNLGPLLYHYSDIPNEDSIEPSYDVVREVILKMGFQIEKEDRNICTTYAQNPRSMMRFEYSCVLLVCRKPII